MDHRIIGQIINENRASYGPNFLRTGEDFWLAKEVLLHGHHVEMTEHYRNKYPTMAAFEGDFLGFEQWYQQFFTDELINNRSRRKSPLTPEHQARIGHFYKELKLFCGEPLNKSMFPFEEAPMKFVY